MGDARAETPGSGDYRPGRLSFLGRLHWRLLLVVLVSILPFLALVLHAGSRRREASIRAAGREVERIARIAARTLEKEFEDARHLLEGAAGGADLPSLPEEERLEVLQTILRRHPGLLGIRLVRTDGTVLASAVEGSGPLPVDPDLPGRAAATGRMAVGSFRVSDALPATVEMVLPAGAGEGEEPAVLSAVLQLGWLEEFQRTLQLSSDANLLILSPAGEVLVRVPAGPAASLGKVHPVPESRRTVALGDDRPVAVEDLDGVRRYFGTSSLATGGTNRGYFVVVGVPEEEVLAPADEALRTDLAWTLAVFLVALAAARAVGERFILRRVNGLILATKRLASTDLRNLKARRRVCQDPSELGDLERSFDLMALHLEERAQELEAKARAIEEGR